ncbi:hypothetical protein EZV62_000922 [Acer yangbiense]|uniref:Uncharacterized protein n=1 Tax=Acer yangbiense TaxID=1000413 RepID=A0A5C7ISH3_9ROSI|nr:hypothetical protein EZV62_000922 [Acer yangbiense]
MAEALAIHKACEILASNTALVRVQILGKNELPSLNEVISMVRAEKSRRGVMLQPSPLEGLAMVSTGGNRSPLKLDQLTNDNGRTDFPKPSNRDNLWCTYCKRPRHTKDR